MGSPWYPGPRVRGISPIPAVEIDPRRTRSSPGSVRCNPSKLGQKGGPDAPESPEVDRRVGKHVVLPTVSATRVAFRWGQKGVPWWAFLELRRMSPQGERVLVRALPRKGKLARTIGQGTRGHPTGNPGLSTADPQRIYHPGARSREGTIETAWTTELAHTTVGSARGTHVRAPERVYPSRAGRDRLSAAFPNPRAGGRKGYS
eukprot:scaffold226_cov271-Pavlova_lutheri.AAC.4